MSVLIEAISVVVRVSTIESRYPGGMEQYVADRPNQTLRFDGHLARVGFMSANDVGTFVERLRRAGLVFFEEGRFIDIAVVDQREGPTATCDWLEFTTDPGGPSVAWLASTAPGALSTPRGWTPDQSRYSGRYGRNSVRSSAPAGLREAGVALGLALVGGLLGAIAGLIWGAAVDGLQGLKLGALIGGLLGAGLGGMSIVARETMPVGNLFALVALVSIPIGLVVLAVRGLISLVR